MQINLNNIFFSKSEFFTIFFSVNSIVIFSSVQSQVDVDKLFHANPPSLSSNGPANAQWPQSNSNDQHNDGMSENVDNFQVFRGPRHDEFDWSLTKVKQDL